MKPKGTIKESIENLHQLCLTQFEELAKKVDDVDRKCSALDTKVNGLVAKSGMGGMRGMGGIGNFVSIENKTDYLNHHFGSVALSSAPFLPFIQREIGVSETDVEMVLKGTASIYDVVADRLVELVEKYADTQRFLYAFAFQKQVLYYWNQGGDRDPCGSWYGGDEGASASEGEGRGASEGEGRGASEGGTWEKMGNKEACAMFEVVQQKLIQIYTTMIRDKHDGIRGVDVVEFGHRLFVNNFDTKSADFKKKLFLGLSGV